MGSLICHSRFAGHRVAAVCSRELLWPRKLPLANARAVQFRRSTTQTGTNYTGHLDLQPSEGLLYFNNIYPLKVQWILRIPFLPSHVVEGLQTSITASTNPSAIFKDALKGSELSVSSSDAQINDVIPHLKDGGAFLRFSHSAPASTVARVVEEHLKKQHIRPWWNPLTRVRARLCQGRPWLEDLCSPPTAKLRVEFVSSADTNEATELSQEQLYSVFRPYGKLLRIDTQPADSKILPKYATVVFANTRRATLAKNCLHGFKFKPDESATAVAKLKMSYEGRNRKGWFFDYIVNHPRVVIPLLAALLTGFAVIVFDPIRTFFVKIHVKGSLNLSQNRVWKWLTSRTRELLTFSKRQEGDSSLLALMDDRKGYVEQLQKWLLETSDTFIVVAGPRGTGKLELLDQALKYRKYRLIIDCKPIQESRSDAKTIEAMAKAVGYKPVFSWMNSISGLVDLAAQGSVGIKTGFSETLDSQVDKILNTAAAALKQLALEGRSKSDKDAHLNADEFLEAHPEKRPVIVIDNFLHRAGESQVIYDKLASWAAQVTTSGIAHVVFCTHDVSFSKSLGKALPNSIFRTVTLGDMQPSVAKRYVLSALDSEPDEVALDDQGKPTTLTPSQRRKDLEELDSAIARLGGRLVDLEFLTRRVKAGETPNHAVEEIVRQTASELLKLYLLPNGNVDRKWKPEQAWSLIKQLSTAEELRYHEVAVSDAYKGADADGTLQALEQAELINIVSLNGRPQAIRPSKPVFQPAFRLLAGDDVLKARLEMAVIGDSIKGENASIDKMEQELALLGGLPIRPAELQTRIKYLLGKIEKSQANIERLEKQSADCKNVLMSSY